MPGLRCLQAPLVTLRKGGGADFGGGEQKLGRRSTIQVQASGGQSVGCGDNEKWLDSDNIFFLILLWHSTYKLYHFAMYNSVAFSAFVMLCNNDLCLVSHFIPPKRKVYTC